MCIQGYDVIGDVHGMADMLEKLLSEMGYAMSGGAWHHPTRKAIFVGDLVDRGLGQLRTYRLVRAMVEAGSALVVMGNHELNAIAFHMDDGKGGHYRQRSEKNYNQHRGFIEEVGLDTALHAELIEWFLTIPVFLDLDGICVIHACWDEPSIVALSGHLDEQNRLRRDRIADVFQGTANAWQADGTRKPMNPAFHAMETLVKGIEVELPEGLSYADADGHVRTATRIAWWQGAGATYRSAGIIPSPLQTRLPDIAIPAVAAPGYEGKKPLFIGHYWMQGKPTPLTPKVACVDYSVAKKGEMVSYRWSGETELRSDHFHVVKP